MVIIKKLIFTLPFLLSFIAFCIQLNPLLQNSNLIFSLDANVFIDIAILISLLLLYSLFFILFATLAQDRKIILPIIILASLTAPIFLNNQTVILLTVGFLLSFGAIYFFLEKKLTTYLTFEATKLLVPSIKQVSTIIILLTSFSFYLISTTDIKTHGFKLPQGLIDLSLQMTQNMQLPQMDTANNIEAPINLNQVSISPEQIQMLKANPSLLQQFGLDAKMLDELTKPQITQSTKAKTNINPQDLVKPLIEKQIESIIKPYISYIPIFLAVTFFFTLQSLASLFSILLSPLIWLIFLILEKTGFTKFEIETREVKKLAV